MIPIRLKDCNGRGGEVLVARSQVAASLPSWKMRRLDDQPGKPVSYDFSGEAEIDAYWSTERPDVLRLNNPLGGFWTWSGLQFEFGDNVVRCTLVGPPEEER